MTRDDSLALADKLLELINSRPSTPSREEIAALLEAHQDAVFDAALGKVVDASERLNAATLDTLKRSIAPLPGMKAGEAAPQPEPLTPAAPEAATESVYVASALLAHDPVCVGTVPKGTEITGALVDKLFHEYCAKHGQPFDAPYAVLPTKLILSDDREMREVKYDDVRKMRDICKAIESAGVLKDTRRFFKGTRYAPNTTPAQTVGGMQLMEAGQRAMDSARLELSEMRRLLAALADRVEASYEHARNINAADKEIVENARAILRNGVFRDREAFEWVGPPVPMTPEERDRILHGSSKPIFKGEMGAFEWDAPEAKPNQWQGPAIRYDLPAAFVKKYRPDIERAMPGRVSGDIITLRLRPHTCAAPSVFVSLRLTMDAQGRWSLAPRDAQSAAVVDAHAKYLAESDAAWKPYNTSDPDYLKV
jgi:hypothetical protein